MLWPTICAPERGGCPVHAALAACCPGCPGAGARSRL